MSSNFLPFVNLSAINQARDSGDEGAMYDLLVQPLHEELYKRQSFDFIEELSWGQQLLLTYDYLQMQAGQGGLIQFLHNGYVGLLPSMIEQLYRLGAPEMALLLDDTLKVYVLNRDLIESATSVEAFAKLYDELKEFEAIDERYNSLVKPTSQQLLSYAKENLHEFIVWETGIGN